MCRNKPIHTREAGLSLLQHPSSGFPMPCSLTLHYRDSACNHHVLNTGSLVSGQTQIAFSYIKFTNRTSQV